MALTKTKNEIDSMREGGHLLSRALKAACDAVRPGVTLSDIDAVAEQVIREGGGEPSFKGYKSHADDEPFPTTLCISVNEEVVHGRGDRPIVLKEGDIVGLDIGLWYNGLCTDMAATVPVGHVSEEAAKLIAVTREACLAGANVVHVGGLVSDVAKAVESVVEPHGYGIVRALVGHGVGHKVHEGPHIPNYSDHRYPRVEIVEGMCLAIEPMIGLGTWDVETAEDGWTVVMKDRKLAAHFEVTIVVTKDGIEVLTPLPV
ncbi:type I methionyl aminopeptidase [Candidatus Uhrbacteria bacterium RIFOXYB2_FULL_57_15]|uniref:Methionine aminopeptidase n=1 Tax=Candidatus Uhrbacteria bacterium RIFOXYB2_FULL_57_15 TaxID=1802422 RepID=A0A1F7W8U1_9BACT|nr:MAG: type I methionyl aminopeptidase [Candidatus Uhrbacteria bacterium RIFOXYB2_FULL_57_15]OGM00236.1 MAG: type I methionyl aminopeptidase [Candidatus Uhrbacteria bacterium RIFOXYC12_FULL_57_11]